MTGLGIGQNYQAGGQLERVRVRVRVRNKGFNQMVTHRKKCFNGNSSDTCLMNFDEESKYVIILATPTSVMPIHVKKVNDIHNPSHTCLMNFNEESKYVIILTTPTSGMCKYVLYHKS